MDLDCDGDFNVADVLVLGFVLWGIFMPGLFAFLWLRRNSRCLLLERRATGAAEIAGAIALSDAEPKAKREVEESMVFEEHALCDVPASASPLEVLHECAVCYEPMHCGTVDICGACGHTFHFSCITAYLKTLAKSGNLQSTVPCPICRAAMDLRLLEIYESCKLLASAASPVWATPALFRQSSP